MENTFKYIREENFPDEHSSPSGAWGCELERREGFFSIHFKKIFLITVTIMMLFKTDKQRSWVWLLCPLTLDFLLAYT